MTQLTEHFSLKELTRSDAALRKGLDNTPPPEVVETLKETAAGLEQVRLLLGVRMFITSGYRSPNVNTATGGSQKPPSQHMKGEAADFDAPDFGSARDVCIAIRDSDIVFDQLIQEGDWTHISFSEHPRHSVLTAHFAKGKATYTQGIA